MLNGSLALKASTHLALKDHLLADDKLESAAIMLCHFGKGARGFRLMVKEVIPIPADKCEKRTSSFLSWPFEAHISPEKISRIEREGLSVFTIHSHPRSFSDFSGIDDQNDRALFRSIYGWFDDGRPHGSSIMLPDASMKARVCDKGERFFPIGSVSVVGDSIKIWKQQKAEGAVPGYGIRVLQTFGKGTFNRLRQLKVGVVGCSGTGSIVVELLARNCVGSIVLADPDLVEEKNLNRIINARRADAQNGIPKVEVLKRAVEEMGMDVHVDAYKSDTYSRDVLEALTDCDVIFGCVDSAAGRYHLECLASAYLLPYFDVGVYLQADGKGGIAQADAAAHYVHPENGSLLDRKVYTSGQVTSEGWRRDDKNYYENQRREGYLEGIAEDQPAVLSVNMQAACLSFNDFLARLHGFRLDSNSEFGMQQFQLVQGCYLNQDGGNAPNPIFEKYLGMGERSLLIRNLKRGKAP